MSKLRVKFYALHGFLGLPSDWEGFAFEKVRITSAPSLWEWARAFNESILRKEEGTLNYLIGYSMGGRLALHALLDRPTLWEGGILLSTHPGLLTKKEERIQSDETWARRFEEKHDRWEEVVKDWMAQPVFKDSKEPKRWESQFDRSVLAAQLRNFSLGKQEKLNSTKALWLVGERDEIFRQILPDAIVVPDSGHRILFDNPDYITHLTQKVQTKERIF